MSKNRDDDRLDTIVGPETSVRGDFHVKGGIRLDGQVEGRLEVTETIVTGPRSLLKGELRCRAAVIAGRVEGDIFAAGGIELQRGAQVFGNLSCSGLVVQPECLFHGYCSMVQASGRAET